MQDENKLEKAKDVIIILESTCSYGLSHHQGFSTSLVDLFNKKKYKEMEIEYLGHSVN